MKVIKRDTILGGNIYISLLNKTRISIILRHIAHIIHISLLYAAFCFLLTTANPSFAQVVEDQVQLESEQFAFGMDTEVGILKFDNSNGKGERYLSSVLAPSFSFKEWQAGLRLRYRWNAKGLRDEDYDSSSDYLSILRFVQFSEKSEPGYYGRLGDMDDALIGYGQFVNRFRNTLSLNEPQTGIIFDYIGPTMKIEGLWSNLASPEVYAIRYAIQPYLDDSISTTQGLTMGMTLAGDLSEDARWENEHSNGLPFFLHEIPKGADSLGLGLAKKQGPLTMLSFDAGIPIGGTNLDLFEGYAELGNIFGLGSGLGLGLKAESKIKETRVAAWFEQRLLGREYLPSYFNSRYEVDRFKTTSVTLANGEEYEAINTKRNALKSRDKVEWGSYIGMEFRFKSKYRLKWSLEHSWSRKQSGWFKIDFLVADPNLPFQFRWVFDRVNMNSLNDIFYGADTDGLLRLEVAYLIKKHLLIGFQYRESFESVENLGKRIGQKKRISIQPSIIIRL